jgi:hypothetical protein
MIYGLKEFIKKQFGTDQYELRGEFPMLHAGWECDETVVMIVVEGTVYAVGSNHGAACLLSKADLLDKVQEYYGVLAATLAAAESLD